MPDMTIEIYPMCASLQEVVVKNVGGYKQTLYNGAPLDDECTCPAYKYSRDRDCKHLREARMQLCGWHGAYDEPAENEDVCPSCGGPTVYVRVAV